MDGDSLVVYTTDIDVDVAMSAISTFAPMSVDKARVFKDQMVRSAPYAKVMRFVLTDNTARHFNVERWCFLGSIDDWYFLSGGEGLKKLIQEYVPHLGRESFFELI